MHIKFNKNKFNCLFLKFFSIFIVWLIPTSIIILIALGIQDLGSKVSEDPFKMHTIFDIAMIGCWISSPIIAIILWYQSIKGNISKNINTFFIYPVITSLISLIPICINPNIKTPNAINIAVENTKIFFYVSYVALVLAFSINLFLSRQVFKKSNWWLFIVALPYLFTGILLYKAQQVFYRFIKLDDFSYKNVSNMLNHMQYADVRLINPIWYQIIALTTVATVVLIGVNLSEIIWKKTKNWRQEI